MDALDAAIPPAFELCKSTPCGWRFMPAEGAFYFAI